MRKFVALVFFISLTTTIVIAQYPGQEIKYGNENHISVCHDAGNYIRTLTPQVDDSNYSYVCRDTIQIGFIFIDKNPDTLFRIVPNVPNPFSNETTFGFYLPEDNFVEVLIYNVQGQLLDVTHAYFRDKGTGSITYRNTKLSTGIYYYQIKIDGGAKTGKMMVVK